MKNISLIKEDAVLFFKYKLKRCLSFAEHGGERLSTDVVDYNIPPILNLTWSYDRVGDSYFIECSDLPNIYSAANDIPTLAKSFNDAIYHFFKVPQEAAIRMGNKFLTEQDLLEQIAEVGNKPINMVIKPRIQYAR